MVVGAVLLVALVGIGIVALTGDDDDDDSTQRPTTETGGDSTRDAYVQVMVDAADLEAREMFGPEGIQCVAGATVDAFGIERLEAAGTPEELAAVDGEWETLGLETDRALAEDVYDGIAGCIDVRQLLQDQVAGDSTLPPGGEAMVTCMFDELTDEELRELFVADMVDGVTSTAMDRSAMACQHLAPG